MVGTGELCVGAIEAMAALILPLVNGVVIASVVDPDGPDHRAVAAQFLTLLLAAGTMASGPEAAQPEMVRSNKDGGS